MKTQTSVPYKPGVVDAPPFFNQVITGLPLKELLQQTLMDGLDVRRLLRISRGTLYNICKKSLLPYSRIGSRQYFDAVDVQKLLQDTKVVGGKK